MDLLAGYGSSSDDDEGGRAGGASAAAPPPASAVAAPAPPAPSGGMFDGLPPPSTSALGGLPPPKRRAVFRPRVDPAALAPSDSDSESEKKKVRVRGGVMVEVWEGARVPTSPLPPQPAPSLGGLSLPAPKRRTAPKRDPLADAVAAREAAKPAGGPESNAAYRVGAAPAGPAPPPPASTTIDPYAASCDYDAYAAATAGASRAPRAADVALAAELAVEAARVARSSGPSTGLSFVEVSQDALTARRPGEVAAAAAAAAAGAAAARRAAAAAGDGPGKVAKRKHQITSLFHQARLAEAEYAAGTGRGAKTKAETQAKYGW
jgi:proline-rich protein PRCC